ncbi:hypothetical protein L570_3014 [Bordetella pertussis 2356847]|nr:hypothetical protein L570_3014 [Bordetella pertussis 2356847]
MNWGVGDQFLKSGSDEPCIQPIESSQLAANCVRWGRFPILPLRCKPVPCGTSTIC